MIEAFRTLKTWQVVVLLAIVIGTAWGVYGIYDWATGSSARVLAENTQLVSVRYGDLTNSVNASGSVVFPISEQLTFDSAGTAQEINFVESDKVNKDDVLAKLDNASILSLEVAVAQARIDLRDAEDDLEDALNPYSQSDLAAAEVAVAQAKVDLEDARDDLEDALNPYSASDLAAAEEAVKRAGKKSR